MEISWPQLLTEISVVFGGGTVLLAIVGWLMRQLYVQMMRKDFERFAEKLRFDYQLRLTESAHQLDLMKLEHEVKFSALHRLRFKKLHALHLKSCELSQLLMDAIKPSIDQREERFQKAIEGIDTTIEFLMQIQIFIPKAFEESWRAALGDAISALHEFAKTTSWETSDWEEDRRRLTNAVESVNRSIKMFQTELASLARDVLEGNVQMARVKQEG